MAFRVVLASITLIIMLSNTNAQAQDKVGVAECDEYLTKLQTCISSLPQAQGQPMASTMEQMRAAWRGAAQTPQGKASLGAACKQAADMAKAQLSASGCKC